MCFHVGYDERSTSHEETWCVLRWFSHSGRHRLSWRRNESWRAPMLVERGMTVERRNALGVLLRDSRIVVDAGCPSVLLCW